MDRTRRSPAYHSATYLPTPAAGPEAAEVSSHPPLLRERLVKGVRSPGLWLAAVSFALCVLWAFSTEPFDAPDELAHLQVVMEMRRTFTIPESHYTPGLPPEQQMAVSPGDRETRAWAQQLGINDPYRYLPAESERAPLYYMTVAATGLPFAPDPHAMLYIGRLVAALFGALTVYFVWRAVRELAPRSPLWALGAAGFVALLPQFCFISASVSPESAVDCAAALLFFLWFRTLRVPQFDRWLFISGAVLGLALLTKMSMLAFLPAFGVVVLLRAYQSLTNSPKSAAVLRRSFLLLASAGTELLIVAGPFMLRNMIVYGEPTGLATGAAYDHTALPSFDLQQPEVLQRFLGWTWESFWGRYGGIMQRWMPGTWYELAGYVTVLLLALALVALVVWAVRAIRAGQMPTVQGYVWGALLLMAVVGVTLVIGLVQYSVQVAFAPQGRYLFPLLVPAGLLLTSGLYWLPSGRVAKALALGSLLVWLAAMNWAGLAVLHSS